MLVSAACQCSVLFCCQFGRQFVEVFIRQGMPLLDHMFRGSRDDVTSVLKNLQLSTRALQHLCGHSKVNHYCNQ